MSEAKTDDPEKPDPKTVVALMAHPDDELGCIGLLANHAKRGDRVILAWTTYGELASAFSELDNGEVAEIRKKHGDEIASIVGGESYFFGYPDCGVLHNREVAVAIAKKLAEWKPDVIITWHKSDSHPDHRNTSMNVMDAMRFVRIPKIVEGEAHREPIRLLTYFDEEKPGWVETYVDITDEIEKKHAAVKRYADVYGWERAYDWVETGNRYRGMECGVRYAERFLLRRRGKPHVKFID